MDDKYYFLLNRFTWDKEREEFLSNKKLVGAGTGDDSTLHIYIDETTTMMYWKQNRGYERTIFDGRNLSKGEMELVFELLEIRQYLRWKDL